MKPYILETLAEGDLFSVPGIQGSSCKTGVKPSGSPDLSLIVADQPMTSAAMFTKNECAAAPVHLSRARVDATLAVIAAADCDCAALAGSPVNVATRPSRICSTLTSLTVSPTRAFISASPIGLEAVTSM